MLWFSNFFYKITELFSIKHCFKSAFLFLKLLKIIFKKHKFHIRKQFLFGRKIVSRRQLCHCLICFKLVVLYLLVFWSGIDLTCASSFIPQTLFLVVLLVNNNSHGGDKHITSTIKLWAVVSWLYMPKLIVLLVV